MDSSLVPHGRALSSTALASRPAAPGLRSQPAGVQCPASTWALEEQLVSPSVVRPVQAWTPNLEVENKVTVVGLPLFRGWMVERGLQGWGGQRAARGPGSTAVSLTGTPPSPRRSRDEPPGAWVFHASRDAGRGGQPRAVAVPFPFLGQGHLHSWVQRVQFLFRLVLRRTSSEGAVPAREPRELGAKESTRGRGPCPWQSLPSLQGSANARLLPLAGHCPAEPRARSP